jgi:Dimerisation domain
MAISNWRPRTDIEKLSDNHGFGLGLDGHRDDSQQPRAPSAPTRTHALLEAHQVTQVLLTALDLGVPAALASGARSAPALAESTGTEVQRLERLLRALAAVGIVGFEEGLWALAPGGDALVAPAGDGEALHTHAQDLMVIRTVELPSGAHLADIGAAWAESPSSFSSAGPA